MESRFVEVKSNGIVSAKRGKNKRTPYDHQKKAMKNLDIIDESPSYSTLVVLPTGGGKTYTASMWLLRHALNNHKKILWIAHRQMLLDQAAESFQKYAYAENLPNISSFSYHSRSMPMQRTSRIYRPSLTGSYPVPRAMTELKISCRATACLSQARTV